MLTYFADDALNEAGFKVEGRLNLSGVKLAYEPAVGLFTGEPQAIQAQARKIRSILAGRPAADDTRPARPAANTSP